MCYEKNEIGQGTTVNDLATSFTLLGIASGDFETLDSKIVSGLMNILHGDFRKRVFNEEEKHKCSRGG